MNVDSGGGDLRVGDITWLQGFVRMKLTANVKCFHLQTLP